MTELPLYTPEELAIIEEAYAEHCREKVALRKAQRQMQGVTRTVHLPWQTGYKKQMRQTKGGKKRKKKKRTRELTIPQKLRKAFSGMNKARIKRDLVERDGTICKLCGEAASHLDGMTIDHIMPLSRGGTNDINNLQLAHGACNWAKGSNILEVKHGQEKPHGG